jgi:hypothetical protein
MLLRENMVARFSSGHRDFIIAPRYSEGIYHQMVGHIARGMGGCGKRYRTLDDYFNSAG